MADFVFVVPRGAEERVVRRAAGDRAVVVVAPGAVSALPADLPAGPVLIVGLAGALRGLRVGELALYREVVGPDGVLALDDGLARGLAAALPRARPVRAFTADHVVARRAERAALADRWDVDVVDMEGLPLARELAARGRPCAMLRAISDDGTSDLPPIEHAIDPQGAVRPMVLLAGFARDPQAATRFVGGVARGLWALSLALQAF